MVRELLKRGASVDLPSSFGLTALSEAARYSHPSIVLVLLQHSADPDLQDIYGQTALLRAADRGHEACVQALLQAKANPDLQATNGITALITEWLRTKDTSPKTGATLESKALIPNYSLRSVIRRFVEARAAQPATPSPSRSPAVSRR